jgi:serine/threonine protein kinase
MASLEDYRLGQVIAKGSFGADIRHGRYHKKDEQWSSSSKKSSSYLHVSIKCVSKRSLSAVQPAQRARSYGLAVVQEQQLLRRFGGNLCVPKLYACFHDVDHVVTVTECCTGGSLQDVIVSLSHDATALPSWREHIAVQLFDILVFLHTSSIVHGDLSPSVLHLTADGNLRLVDFGHAVDLRNNNVMAIRPQTCFSAPELWHDEVDSTVVVSTAVDLWSAGCICFALHATHSPFAAAATTTNTTSTIRSTTTTPSPQVTSMPHKKRKVEELGTNNEEDDAKPAASPAAMQAQVDATVGQRIATFTKEYHDNNNATSAATATKEESSSLPATKKNTHPQLLVDLPFFNDDEMWRDIVYELLHPDPLSRTQAATRDKTTGGDLYDAIRNRFLQSMADAAAAAGTTTTVTAFQPPVPRWLREDEESSNSSSSSSGDASSGDDTN